MTERDERLKEIAGRVEKATDGPWQTRFIHRLFCRVRESPGDLAFNTKPKEDWVDADFIAHSRSDIPWLLQELSAADAENVGLRARDIGWAMEVDELKDENARLRERLRVMEDALGKIITGYGGNMDLWSAEIARAALASGSEKP